LRNGNGEIAFLFLRNKKDPIFSCEMKKSIASIFQACQSLEESDRKYNCYNSNEVENLTRVKQNAYKQHHRHLPQRTDKNASRLSSLRAKHRR